MGLIRPVRGKGKGGLCFLRLVFFTLSALAPGIPVHAQNLGAEIQRIEQSLENSGLSGAERRDALIRLARLEELAGDLETAARLWGEAAAGPGGPDDLALIRGAWCLAAMGDWDQAGAVVKTLLLAGRPGPAMLKARYLGAFIEALETGNFSALKTLAETPDFVDLKPALYYTLWKTQSSSGEGESWKTRLLSEFPRSPEGRIAASGGVPGGKGLAEISAAPTPMWLLLPGRENLGIPAEPRPAASGPAPSVSAAPASAAPAPREKVLLQTGLFSSEGNARKQADQLRAAGFSSVVVRRSVKGVEYWAAGVFPGQTAAQLGGQLKNAGFESFPVNLE
jgi:hypothetical protein